ncbi:MAG: pseudouridine synthase [Caldithrix sp.]|nr:MAG: pseudouridine synthase [Caldithrix sp.]
MLRSPLPTVDGVSPSCKFLPAGHWKTVLDFLKERYPKVLVSDWLSRMKKGEVVDENGRALNPDTPYCAGIHIFYYREVDSEIKIPFLERIIHEDEHILVIDKPHFLPVTPSGRFLRETLLVRLKKNGKWKNLVPLHRIDRETAGIVLFSHNPATRGKYAFLFQSRMVTKVYEALAPSNSDLSFPLKRRSRIVRGEPFFRMKEVEGISNAETDISFVEEMAGGALYKLQSVTGKKHQIRLHLASVGIPIFNDRLYPDLRDKTNDDFFNPLRLLVKALIFKDPITGQARCFGSAGALEQ